MMRSAISKGESVIATSFDDFFRAEYPRLVPMLHAVLGDRSWAEDLAQEALASAQQAWPKVSGYDRPGAWVRRVALNRASNVRRSRGREAVALHRLGPPGGATADAPPDDERLWRLVRDLPEQQRFAVALHYVEDRSVADIAATLGCSDGTVKTHLSRARATLARRLSDSRKEATS
jgi:RNA polymerase sigma-70 factor (ECF subfamily)